MCGIVGIINIKNKTAIKEKQFTLMVDLLSHRGPNDSGIFIDKNVAFGHRRLSILDLSPLGKQPMSNSNSEVWIIYNGEVYNFIEIKKDLEEKGYTFKSSTDTEVILNAYIEYGIKFLNILRGMFSFAIYDKRINKIFIVRDRLGIKPLYYSQFNGKLIFSSEIKSILHYPGFPVKENLTGISSYLSFRYPIYDYTMFDKIKSLLPGNYIEVDLNKSKTTIKEYWNIPIFTEKEDKGENFYLSELRNLLVESVKYRMISDVPIGAYLSGGLDSSIIVAIMSKISSIPIKTFNIGFTDKEFNEFYYARKVSEMYKTDHYEIILSEDNYIENMLKLIEYKDSPLGVANEPALYMMSKELKKYITVVLSGEGADEIFAGYGRIFRSPYDFERIALLNQYKKLEEEEIIKKLKININKKYGHNIFKDEVDFFLFLYQYISWKDKSFFFSDDFLLSINKDEDIKLIFYNYFKKINNLNMYEKFIWIFEKIHLVGLLNRLDITTMATSVEARVPFVDHLLVEFAMSIPIKYKLKWKSLLHKLCASVYNTDQISETYDITKYILRKAFTNDLPKEVINRKKMGFPVPIHKWFGNNFKNFVKEIVLSRKAKSRGIYNIKNISKFINKSNIAKNHNDALKLWMLLNLEIWFQKYIDS